MLALFDCIKIKWKKIPNTNLIYKNIIPLYYNKMNAIHHKMLCRKIEKNINKKMEKFTKNYRQIFIIDVKYKM